MKGATAVRILRLERGIPGFNPRTREGCDAKLATVVVPVVFVSIHAPVKGATHLSPPKITKKTVSIHAPVKGATSYLLL